MINCNWVCESTKVAVVIILIFMTKCSKNEGNIEFESGLNCLISNHIKAGLNVAIRGNES